MICSASGRDDWESTISNRWITANLLPGEDAARQNIASQPERLMRPLFVFHRSFRGCASCAMIEFRVRDVCCFSATCGLNPTFRTPPCIVADSLQRMSSSRVENNCHLPADPWHRGCISSQADANPCFRGPGDFPCISVNTSNLPRWFRRTAQTSSVRRNVSLKTHCNVTSVALTPAPARG